MTTQEIVSALNLFADYLEIRGESHFRVRSYRQAARALADLGEEVAPRVEAGTLEEIEGIGKGMVGIITELVSTGTCQRLEELREEIPPGWLQMARVPGLGPKKVKLLAESLGVETLEELAGAAADGRLAAQKGFGAKTSAKVLEGVRFLQRVAGRHLLPRGLQAAETLTGHLAGTPGLERLEVAGSVRRRLETVGDVDLVAAAGPEAAGEILDRFVAAPGVVARVSREDGRATVLLDDGLPVTLSVVAPERFAVVLAIVTGSEEHLEALREHARETGFRLEDEGLLPLEGEGAPVALATEDDLYGALGLPRIEPELREGRGEIGRAREGEAESRLLEREDLRGMVHLHTTYSDGLDTLEDMATAALELGYEYLGVSDHSQSAGYAGGLKAADIRRQHAEIDRLNERLAERGFRIFKGIESDIRADGSLDYPEDVLETFDFVIAAVHSGFQLTETEQTARVIRALESPFTTFLAHPTGRLLLRRDGYAIDIPAVLEAAGELGVAVEINANPRRLDLDWRWGSLARELGVRTAIHPDAHRQEGYGDVAFGVGTARKAGFGPPEVTNCLATEAYEAFLKTRR